MPRFRLTLAFDGAPFEGWQSQPGGNTVQDKLESALSEIAGEPIRAHGSGRTDTGVHALGQVAHFDAPQGSRMDSTAWQRAINTKLPRTVRVLAAEEVADEFHARFSATAKTYRYEIDTGDVLSPLRLGRAWHHPTSLDRGRFAEACALYLGEHDFAAFAANRRDGKDPNTVRKITHAGVTETDTGLSVTFTGNGFLYKMVRLLVGAAVRVAGGREELSWIQGMLDERGGAKCPFCAPGAGLYLVSVDYG